MLIERGTPLIFVSGKAGTGKSTLIRYLRFVLEKKNVVVLAPTGVAALQVEGATLHSFFKLPPRIAVDGDIKELRDRSLYRATDLIIIDEISMVRADMIDAIDLFLRLNGKDKNAPFGGSKLLLIGDLFQLPPVVNRSEEEVLDHLSYRSPFFFSAKCLANVDLVPIELTKMYRQKDKQFTKLLNAIRVAEDIEESLAKINTSCVLSAEERPTLIALCSTNAKADEINDRELAALRTAPEIFIGAVTGNFRRDNHSLPAPMNLVLKVGAQVMFTKNDEGKRWVNATLGRVVGMSQSELKVQIQGEDDDSVVEVKRAIWKNYKYVLEESSGRIVAEEIGTYLQFPLTLAWAVTIHKAQGKTLPKVTVDLGNGAFASGQVYVALSRCRSLSDIRLARPIRAKDVRCDLRSKAFFEATMELQKESANVSKGPKRAKKAVKALPLDTTCPVCGGELAQLTSGLTAYAGCSNCNYVQKT
jgi:ATP-dependent exoDNAse (exonuclease V) alpha subunit